MNQATKDTDSGKPRWRIPRPRLLSMGLALAGVTVIGAGFFLQGSAPAVDPSPPAGYGPTADPALGPILASPSGPAPGGPDGGLLPDPTATEMPVEDGTPAPAVPVFSGRLEDLSGEQPAEPVRLLIAALGIDAPIQAVGVTDDGEMEVPARADLVAWYRFGPTPGDPGSAVLAAHVSWGGKTGVFYRLRDLPQGTEIQVQFSDGTTRRFRSAALASYDKSDLPVEQIFEREGYPVLTLITCGGDFNPSLRRFEQNIVAYGVPIQPAAPDLTPPEQSS